MDDDAADGTTSDRTDDRELLAIEEAWATAIVSNDADRIARFIAEDWVIVSDSGTTSAEQFLSLIRIGALSHSAMTPLGDWRVRVYDAAATVTVRMASTATYRGRSFDADEWTTDVFVKRNGRWLCVSTCITPAAG